MEKFKVKITKAGMWYGGRIGEAFEVTDRGNGYYKVVGKEGTYICSAHCERVRS